MIQDKAQFKTDLTMRELMSNVAFAPALKRKYTQEDFARIASDDSRQLSLVENALKQTSDVGRSVFVGLVPGSVGPIASGMGEYYNSVMQFYRKNVLANIPGVASVVDKLEAEEGQLWERNPELAKTIAPFYGPGNLLKTYGAAGKEIAAAYRPKDIGFEDQVAEAIGQILLAVGVTAVTGNPMIATGGFMAMGADTQAQNLRAAGLDPEDRFGELSAGAAITGGTELLRLNRIMDILPPKARQRIISLVVSRIAGQAVEEGAQEALENLAQNLLTMTYDPEATAFEGVAEAASVGAAASAIFQTGIELLMPGRQRAPTAEALAARAAREERSAEGQLIKLQDTLDAAAQSKLVKRDRAALEEFADAQERRKAKP
jgi:hypothetical protein